MLALTESSIQLVPDGTLLLHFVLVLVMIAVLNRSLLRPINRVLAERELRTGGKMSDAKQIAAAGREKMRLWEKGLRDARNEGYRMLGQERAKAVREREELVQSLKSELTTFVSEHKAALARQQIDAEAALRAESHRLAEMISSRVLGRTIRG